MKISDILLNELASNTEWAEVSFVGLPLDAAKYNSILKKVFGANGTYGASIGSDKRKKPEDPLIVKYQPAKGKPNFKLLPDNVSYTTEMTEGLAADRPMVRKGQTIKCSTGSYEVHSTGGSSVTVKDPKGRAVRINHDDISEVSELRGQRVVSKWKRKPAKPTDVKPAV